MAHEPDLFTQMPPRVSLTLSGHTHGGQVRLMGWSPIVPSEFGNRFAYGHIIEMGAIYCVGRARLLRPAYPSGRTTGNHVVDLTAKRG